MCVPNPDGRLWELWYPAAFDFPADFLSMFHILFSRLVNQADLALFLLMCPIAGMYLIELFDQAMPHNVIFQGFGVGIYSVGLCCLIFAKLEVLFLLEFCK